MSGSANTISPQMTSIFKFAIRLAVAFVAVPFFLTSAGATRREAPEWTRVQPKSKPGFKYYVGRSHPSASEKAAFKEAMDDAFQQAIAENFGVSASYESKTTETLNDSVLEKRSYERTAEIRLNGFEKVEYFLSDPPDIRAYVLMQYPISEIEAEKKRLESVPEKHRPPDHANAIGNKHGISGGALVVVTDPEGAEIKIDHKPWGITPVELYGGLEPGEHSVDLFLKGREPVLNEKVTIRPNQTTRLVRAMRRVDCKLGIHSDPAGAFITVNGKPHAELTPTTIVVPEGEELSLSFAHPETEPYKTVITAIRSRELPGFVLRYKPSAIVVDTSPSNAKVLVDGVYRGETGRGERIELEHGDHEIEFEKDHYRTGKVRVDLRGGEERVVDTVRLEYVDEPPVLPRTEVSKTEGGNPMPFLMAIFTIICIALGGG